MPQRGQQNPERQAGESTLRPEGSGGSAGFLGWAHSSLSVTDVAPAIRFFEDAFGFEVLFAEPRMSDPIASMTGLPALTCSLVQLRQPVSGHVLELIAFAPPDGLPAADPLPLRPGSAHVAFLVDDLIRAKACVERLGAVTLGRITDFEEGPALYCRVPGGAFIELEQAVAR